MTNLPRGITIEKLLSTKTFLLLFSFTLFIDVSMLMFSDKSINDINFDFLKYHLSNAFIILVFYAFFMSVVIVSWIYFLREIFGLFPSSIYNLIYPDNHTKDEDMQWNHELKDIAIKYDNSVLYDIYKKNEVIAKNSLSLKIISVSIVLLLFIDCLYLFNENKTSLIELYLHHFIESQNTFYFIIHLAFLLLISTAILLPIFTHKSYKKVHLKKETLDFIEKENMINLSCPNCPKLPWAKK